MLEHLVYNPKRSKNLFQSFLFLVALMFGGFWLLTNIWPVMIFFGYYFVITFLAAGVVIMIRMAAMSVKESRTGRQ